MLRHTRASLSCTLIALGLALSTRPIPEQTMCFFRPFGTLGIDRPYAVTTDASGIYVIGNRPAPQGGPGSAGVRKYDSRGNELWTQEFVPGLGSVTLFRAADAYGGYDAFFKDPARGLTELGCWSHARRYFHKRLESDQARMGPALLLIAQLYRVEQRARGLTSEDRLRLRQLYSRGLLEKLHDYLVEIEVEVLPKSPEGRAVRYALKNWAALTRFCADGDLEIDNNRTERALRGVAVGRNNWVFFGSDRGGKTAAVLRSFVASCQRAGVDPFAWSRMSSRASPLIPFTGWLSFSRTTGHPLRPLAPEDEDACYKVFRPGLLWNGAQGEPLAQDGGLKRNIRPFQTRQAQRSGGNWLLFD